MGKFTVGVVALIAGILVGAVGGGMLFAGVGAGIGVATGLSAGICATIQAAQEEGLIDEQQVDQVLSRAAQDLTGKTDLPEGEKVIGGAAECEAVLARLEEASSE